MDSTGYTDTRIPGTGFASVDPTYPDTGATWWNEIDSSWYYWDGAAWNRDVGGAGTGIVFLPPVDLTIAPSGLALNTGVGVILQHSGPVGVINAGYSGVAGTIIKPGDSIISDGIIWRVNTGGDSLLPATRTEMEVGAVSALRTVSPLLVRQGDDARIAAEAINVMFRGLPTVVTAQTITITGNPGAVAADRTIATAKGWVVVG